MTTEFNTEQINNAFGAPGLKITGAFIADVLKVEPARRDKRAMFWDEDQFEQIRTALIKHIKSVPPDPEKWMDLSGSNKSAAKRKAAETKGKAPPTNNDDDDDL